MLLALLKQEGNAGREVRQKRATPRQPYLYCALSAVLCGLTARPGFRLDQSAEFRQENSVKIWSVGSRLDDVRWALK